MKQKLHQAKNNTTLKAKNTVQKLPGKLILFARQNVFYIWLVIAIALLQENSQFTRVSIII